MEGELEGAESNIVPQMMRGKQGMDAASGEWRDVNMKSMYEEGIQAIEQMNAIMGTITPKMNGYQQICRRYKRLSNEVKDCSKLVKRMHKAGVLTDEVEAGIFTYMTELKTQYEFQKKTLEMIRRLHSPYTKEVNALMKKLNEHVKNVDKLLITEEDKGEWDIEKVEANVNALIEECRRKDSIEEEENVELPVPPSTAPDVHVPTHHLDHGHGHGTAPPVVRDRATVMLDQERMKRPHGNIIKEAFDVATEVEPELERKPKKKRMRAPMAPMAVSLV